MNAVDMLGYGHRTLTNAIKDLPEADWETRGVCGVWSVKDIIAHLTSTEHVVAEVLSSFLDGGPTPYIDEITQPQGNFNDAQVERRRGKSVAEVVAEYNQTYAKVLELAAQIPAETYRQNGTISWYGAEYCLDDLIVYINYAHKREHSAEINVYRDRLT